MICLLLAGINMAMFHWLGTRHLEAWDRGQPPLAAKFAGGASLLLWTTIVAAGRWIGFTTLDALKTGASIGGIRGLHPSRTPASRLTSTAT